MMSKPLFSVARSRRMRAASSSSTSEVTNWMNGTTAVIPRFISLPPLSSAACIIDMWTSAAVPGL
jgi:hypothetical protein